MSQAVVQTESKPSLLTPFNVIAGIIVLAGLFVTVLRFTKGLGAVTNLDNNYPWGLWIGFDLLCGVALAAGHGAPSCTQRVRSAICSRVSGLPGGIFSPGSRPDTARRSRLCAG